MTTAQQWIHDDAFAVRSPPDKFMSQHEWSHAASTMSKKARDIRSADPCDGNRYLAFSFTGNWSRMILQPHLVWSSVGQCAHSLVTLPVP
jgi:hypothetical protein